MTAAQVWYVAPRRNHRKVADVEFDLAPNDRAAWLLFLRDWCKRERVTYGDHQIRVPVHARRTEVHTPPRT